VIDNVLGQNTNDSSPVKATCNLEPQENAVLISVYALIFLNRTSRGDQIPTYTKDVGSVRLRGFRVGIRVRAYICSGI
jgi:hypothetical protein